MQANRFATAADALSFALAGNAYITIKSAVTGTRYTYRIKRLPDDENAWWVSVLTGSDNTNDYTYAGIIRGTQFRWGQRGGLDKAAPSIKAFEWVLAWLVAGKLPTNLEIWHEGRCGRCARLLTVPESIARGLGPECAGLSAPRFVAEAVA